MNRAVESPSNNADAGAGRAAAFDALGKAVAAAGKAQAQIEADIYHKALLAAVVAGRPGRDLTAGFAPLIKPLGLGLARVEGVRVSGRAGLWQPVDGGVGMGVGSGIGGRLALIIPARVYEIFNVPADDWQPARSFAVPTVIDLVAVDPAAPMRHALRFGVADCLGALDPASREARLFSTPIAWLRGALAWQWAETGRVAEAEAAARAAGADPDADPNARAVPPGRHGLCVLRPETAKWPALLSGKTQIWCDRPAYGAAITARLKADRKREAGRLPRILTGRGAAQNRGAGAV